MSVDYFMEKKIWFIWLIAILARIVLCFFQQNLFAEELGMYLQLLNQTRFPITFNIAIIHLLLTEDPTLVLIHLAPGYGYIDVPFSNPPISFVFYGIVSPFFALGGIFAVRIFLAIISSLGIITFNLFIKELTRDEELITVSTILYGFNIVGIYFASHVSVANIYFTLIPLILFLFLKQINSTHNKNYILDPTEEPKGTLNIYIILAGLLVVTFNLGLIIPITYAFGLILLLLYSDSRDKLINEIFWLVIFAAGPAIALFIYGIAINHPIAGLVNYSSIIISKSFDVSSFIYYILSLGATVALYLPFAFQGILDYDKNKLNKIWFFWLIILQILCFGTPTLDVNLKCIIYSIPLLLFFTIQGYQEQNGEFWFIKKENYPYIYIIASFVIALLIILATKVIA
ncbi:MAG: hypothetical protein ACFFCM_06225 [Promethearchaeota archaeon]